LKRVLVTGASGFVGANLVRRLLHDGHEIHLIVRPSHEKWRLQDIAGCLKIHETDLEDRDGVFQLVAAIRADWIFHLAAHGAYSHQTSIERMAATNFLGCVALLDACAKVGMEAFVQTGSSSEYGYKYHAAEESELLEPNSSYAITKAAATHYCQHVARKLNVNAVTLRLYSIYGPYEDPNRLIPTLLLHGLRGSLPPLVSPSVARDFVYVDDAVDAILQVAAKQAIPRGAVYNICSGVQNTLKDVVEVSRRLLPVNVEPVWSTMAERSWDTDRWLGSPARMSKEIGWQARANIESGLRKTIEWFARNPELESFYAKRIFDEVRE
jgi:UDP-glucose 4-epimerase